MLLSLIRSSLLVKAKVIALLVNLQYKKIRGEGRPKTLSRPSVTASLIREGKNNTFRLLFSSQPLSLPLHSALERPIFCEERERDGLAVESNLFLHI
jgi:hypothetical protein